MDFWKEGRQFAVDRRKKTKDLWLQPPKIDSEALSTCKNHGWASEALTDEKSPMFEALRSYRVFGYWIGLLPVQNVLGHSPQQLSFRWISKETTINVIIITVFVLTIVYRAYTGFRYSQFGTIDSAAFVVGPMFCGFFTLRQAKLFPDLLKKWARVEKEMKTIGNISNLKTHLDIITALNIAATLGAILCTQMRWYERAVTCSDDIVVQIQLSLVSSFNSLFSVPFYTLNWGAPIALFVQILHRWIWMFTELTFMVFSYSLYHLFKMYYDHLKQFKGKHMSEQFWYQMRIHYNSLSRLTKTLDDFLSPNTCITFAINIFFVCYALFHVLKENPLTHLKLVYFLLYSIIRTLAIALLGSYINDLSRKPLVILYSVPSKSFCSEALRFQMEILADDICLTGCRFFTITRSFIIAVVGTIATYEVVLLQFNTLKNEAFNSTSFCSAFYSHYLVTMNSSLS